ncbi:hypothetical protein [Nostoc sp. CHAB 5715]|uniref:hypothetical protein n=1 Tax=Nostoc sp. CHAB 5715 TaxID=2780400 RepID=UPI001E497CAE|nr:hypothetical protein [Nostoc sp. CHAB 5715]MCC5620373.1 hypothetical protein [Nostoc sp. CHAB 5715]
MPLKSAECSVGNLTFLLRTQNGLNAPLPLTELFCPIPNAQCPMPNSQSLRQFYRSWFSDMW